MNVLGIETSCDETSSAVVTDDRKVLANVVFSQIEFHKPYGGVVPEIASRSHVEVLPDTLRETIRRSGLLWSDLDMIAVTQGPGLATSLVVGIAAAKALALCLKRPLCAINHLEGHIFAPFLSLGAASFQDTCPFVALVASGGHTSLVRVRGIRQYEILGQTVDDAAGEAFDKGASLLGLGYPGGPAIQKGSEGGQLDFVVFPRGRPRKSSLGTEDMDLRLCFSFSGLKTALLYYLRDHSVAPDSPEMAALCASYQEAIVDALVHRCDLAIRDEKTLVVGGGVCLNRRLRERLTEMTQERNVRLLLSDPAYCTDNAAMIAGLAACGGGQVGQAVADVDAAPSLAIGMRE